MHDGNCNTLFIVNAPVGGDMIDDEGTPLYASNDITTLSNNLPAGDYEGMMAVTIIATGDCIDVEVSYHVTEDGLVDVELI